jgi:hypothetical protein
MMNVTTTVTTTLLVLQSFESQWNVWGPIVGAIVGGILTLMGTMFSGRALRERERRRRLSDIIYRPLIHVALDVCQEVDEGRLPNLGEFNKVFSDGMFSLVSEQIRNLTRKMQIPLTIYHSLVVSLEGRIAAIVRNAIDQQVVQPANWERIKAGGYKPLFHLYVYDKVVKSVTLEQCLLAGETPEEFLERRKTIRVGGMKTEIRCVLGSDICETNLANGIVREAMQAAQLDDGITFARLTRDEILSSGQVLVEAVKKHVY